METDWTQSYCLSGLCGLTYKNKKSRKVSLCSSDPDATAQLYEHTLILAVITLHTQTDELSNNFCSPNRNVIEYI